jgi:hypothetical protein
MTEDTTSVTPEEAQQARAVCGLAVFVKPNGGGLVVQAMNPERDPVERVATSSDIRGMIAEIEQKLQAEATVAIMEYRASMAQQQAINEQVAMAATKGNGKLGIVEGLRGRMGRRG